MGDISAAGRSWLRDAVAPGSSAANEPDKGEGRAVLDLIDVRISGLTAGGVASGDTYETVSDLFAAAGDHGHGDTVFVWGDPDPSYRDVWVRLIDPGVPYDGWVQTFIRSGVHVDADGFAVTDGVLLEGVQDEGDRDAYPFVHWLSGANGRAAWGVDAQGRFTARLSEQALAEAAEDGFHGGLPRGFLPVANVRRGKRLTYASTMAEGRVFDVAQRNEGLFNTALVAGGSMDGARAPLEILAVYGQSNAGIGPQQQLVATPLYPNHVVGPDAFDVTYGTSQAPSAAQTDFTPVRDLNAAYGNAPAHLMGWACAGRDLIDGRTSPGYATVTSWEGGEPIASFTEASAHFNWINLMLALAAAKTIAGGYARPVRTSIIFIQGENGAGLTESTLGTLIDALKAEVPAYTAEALPPHVYLFQINNADTATAATGVERTQLAVSVSRLGSGVTLIGPMYQCPLFEEVGDDIHGTELGRMVLADAFALVKAKVDAGETFSPLRPLSSSRAAAIVDVNFAVPAGALAFDTTWVAAAPNKGFRAYLVSSGVELTISSAVILDTDTVRIALSADPGGPVRIDYALAADTTDDGWASGRGQLISPTGVASIWHAKGFAVPATINHYCVRFTLETST